MTQVKNILVGIDLSRADRLVVEDIAEPNRHAIEKAIWLAQHASAKITFISALELSAHTQQMIEQDERNDADVDDAALAVLDEFVHAAKQQNVYAERKLAYGPGWHEIINEVLEHDYDLVMVGTRGRSGMSRLIMGSTAMKLLRYCPCPVWVTKANEETDTTSVLVATDLSPVGDKVVSVGVAVAAAEEAELHILHSVEFPLERPMRLAQAPTDEIKKYREDVRAAAELSLQDQLKSQPVETLKNAPQLHVTEAVPEMAIFDAIDEYKIDLVVMGTVARAGFSRFLIGNTAERILPALPCSVIAVKPDEFVCPVQPE